MSSRKKTIRPDPEKWIKIIETMLEDPKYEFATDYLLDVVDYIETTGQIKPGHTKAILNIRRSKQ